MKKMKKKLDMISVCVYICTYDCQNRSANRCRAKTAGKKRRKKMKKLGIRIENTAKESKDIFPSDFPLLAFSYYRSGYIRLAAPKARNRK